MCRAKFRAIVMYAGVRNSGVLVGVCNYCPQWRWELLEMGQVLRKWLMTGGNQPAEGKPEG